jgi:hypothetical protein
MSKATFNPVIARPIFDRLRFVTPRLFETLGANTIPLFGLDPAHVREIYGEAALELILPEFDPEQKIIDIMSRPEHFADIVRSTRRHLAEKHSHAARIQELIDIVES